jgi:hypothetical protein
MAFKITKIEAKALAEHRIELARLRERIEDEFRALSAELREIALPLNGLISEYNAALDRTKGFIDGVAEEHRDAYDEKSDRWQEGDRGQAALAFVEEWENVYLSEIEEVEIVAPDEPEFGSVDTLDSLPEEADQ